MSEQKKTAEIEYEKLTSFFKELVKWISIVFTLFTGFFGFVFFQDRNAMQNERTALQEAYNQKVLSLEKDITELKNISKETIKTTQIETQTEIGNIKINANGQIADLKNIANNEILSIKISANDLALKETAKQVANVFKQDKIQAIIEQKATNEIQDKVSSIVNEQILTQSESIIKINSWATIFRHGDYYENEIHLKNFNSWLEKEFKNPIDQQRVIKLNYEIQREYNSECGMKAFSLDIEKLYLFDKDIPESASKSKIIEILTNKVTGGRENLHDRCLKIKILSRLKDKSFWCFEDFQSF